MVTSRGFLKFILEDGEEILANSAIMYFYSPAIRKMALECGVSTFDVHNFSKDAVKCFIDACHSGYLKAEIPPSIFRDVNKLAHDYEVAKFTVICLKCFESMAKTVEENDFSTQMNLFDEAMFSLIELKNKDFFNVIKKRLASKTSLTEHFVTKYLAKISSCSAEKLDAVLELTAKKEYILVKVLIGNLKIYKSSLHANSRRILERLDFLNYSSTHSPHYKTLLELLETIENPSKEDYRLIMKILRQSIERNDVIRYNSQNHIAFQNLFLGFKPNLRYSSTLDEILMFLMESPHVRNSYIFYDALETWLVNNRKKSLPDSTIGLFIAIFREQIHNKKWQPLADEYILPKTSSVVIGTLAMRILECDDLTTNTEYRRLPSTLEYTSEQLFSVDHDIELAGQTEESTFFLRVEAATSIKDNSFDVKLITDLMALHNEEFHSSQKIFHLHPIIVENTHFTLDIKKEDEKSSVNVPVGWYNRPSRDGTGNYWCWGPHCFFNEGEGQPLAAYGDTRLQFWGSQARIRPVVYFNFFYRGQVMLIRDIRK